MSRRLPTLTGRPTRDKDAVFVALCEIARQWIREVLRAEEDDRPERSTYP